MGGSLRAKKKPAKQSYQRISLWRFGSLRSHTTLPSTPSSRSKEASFMCKITLGSRVSPTLQLPPWSRNGSDESFGMVKSVCQPTLLHSDKRLPSAKKHLRQ